MRVPTVACIDHRHTCRKGCPQRCALFGVAHGDHIGVVAHHAGGVLHRLALAGGRKLCPCKAQCLAAQPQHGRFKRKAGAGGRLVEQGSQLFMPGHLLIRGRVVMDAVGQVEQSGNFLLGKIQRVDQMSHGCIPPSVFWFRAACVKWKNQRSLCSSSANASPGGTND